MLVLHRRLSPDSYRRITLVALVLLCFIVVSGALVRLSGSGLGCSDWPNCEEGELVAPLEYHALVEFVNRLVTGLVSAAVILAVLGSLVRAPRRRDLTRWSLGLVVGVIAQIVLGGIVVLAGLKPPFVMGHFLVSMVLVANAVVLHHKASQHDGAGELGTGDVDIDDDDVDIATQAGPSIATRLVRVVFALVVIVLVLGTIVTATGPHGGDETAERFDLPLRTVTRVHAGAVWALVALTIALCIVASRALRRGDRSAESLRRAATRLLVFEAVQGAIGYLQYFTDVPPELVALHVAGATATFIAAVQLLIVGGGSFATSGVGPDVEGIGRSSGPGAPVGVGSVVHGSGLAHPG